MNNGYHLRSLAGCSFDELYECHIDAFKDYPFKWSREALLQTIQRRGFDPALSFGAYYNGQLASFTWNGLGTFNGTRAAYDTGTGTMKAHRGKGLASKIFEYSVPFLREAGVCQYVLEVLEENEKAITLYSKQGFTVSRVFDCFRTNISEWNFRPSVSNNEVQLKEIDFSYRPEMEAMFDFTPSWQNNFQALEKNPAQFGLVGAFFNDCLVGFGIVEPGSGDIPLLAVAPGERGKGIGSMILGELKNRIKAGIVKIVNIDAAQTGITSFVKKCGLPKIVSQFEMIKTL